MSIFRLTYTRQSTQTLTHQVCGQNIYLYIYRQLNDRRETKLYKVLQIRRIEYIDGYNEYTITVCILDSGKTHRISANYCACMHQFALWTRGESDTAPYVWPLGRLGSHHYLRCLLPELINMASFSHDIINIFHYGNENAGETIQAGASKVNFQYSYW